jgi:hypothetical protein
MFWNRDGDQGAPTRHRQREKLALVSTKQTAQLGTCTSPNAEALLVLTHDPVTVCASGLELFL